MVAWQEWASLACVVTRTKNMLINGVIKIKIKVWS